MYMKSITLKCKYAKENIKTSKYIDKELKSASDIDTDNEE